MGFEVIYQFREIELDLDTTGAMLLQLFTELPGENQAVRQTATVNTEITTTGRRTWNLRLPGGTKGSLPKLRLTGPSVVRLFGAKILARKLGEAAGWQWYPVPVEPTPELYLEVQLPILPTPDEWSEVELPIEPTGEWQSVSLPIPETPEWGEVALPIGASSDFMWADLPLDAME